MTLDSKGRVTGVSSVSIDFGTANVATAQTADNLSGGAAGSIPYQNSPGSTVFLTEPTGDGYVLTYNNTSDAPQWSELNSLSGVGYTFFTVDSGDNVILRLSDGSTNDDVTITAGSNIQIDSVSSSGFTISAVAGAGLTTDSTISDLISVSGGTISADDAGADRIFFWDDSESKATHLGVGTGLEISGTTLSATSDAGKTYTLDSVDSGDNVILRLSDGSANDDVTITAGSNITINPVASGGFTISAAADGGGGILSDVDVVQENYGCTNPITTATNAGITTITIGENSNAYGTRYVQETEPTGVCDGDIWYDTSDAGGSGNPAGTVIYSASSTTVPAGYIKANGAGLSTTTYADLFAAIGYTYGGSGSSFNVPDLRGEFIRGFDDGKGVDPGRTLGSTQTDQNKQHNHGISDPGHGHDIKGYQLEDGSNRFPSLIIQDDDRQSSPYSGAADAGAIQSNTTGITISNDGGTEARPRNIALLACIKY